MKFYKNKKKHSCCIKALEKKLTGGLGLFCLGNLLESLAWWEHQCWREGFWLGIECRPESALLDGRTHSRHWREADKTMRMENRAKEFIQNFRFCSVMKHVTPDRMDYKNHSGNVYFKTAAVWNVICLVFIRLLNLDDIYASDGEADMISCCSPVQSLIMESYP